MFSPYHKSDAAPLYYAALCGFHDLAEHLIGKYPQQVNAHGGHYVTPLVAALGEEHFKVAELLLRHDAGATVNVRGKREQIPLHSAAYSGQIDVVRLLLHHKAEVNARDAIGDTALHYLGEWFHYRKGSNIPRQLADIARLLLDYGADVNARNTIGWTPLLMASWWGNVTVARVLLEHGANVDEGDEKGKTPFQHASEKKQNEMVKLLSEHGAKSFR